MSLAVGVGLAVIIALLEGRDQNSQGGSQGDTHYHYHYHEAQPLPPPAPPRNRLVSAPPQKQLPPTVDGYALDRPRQQQPSRIYRVAGEREEWDGDWDE
jgi:hypothetical protein